MVKSSRYFLMMMLFGIAVACNSQSEGEPMKDTEKKNFSCETLTGVCAPFEETEIEEIDMNKHKKVRLFYYTDPICSACWAIEPELKKFKLEYGDYVNIEYNMGGLLPNWDGFNDSGNGISKPSDVGIHWDEVGGHTEMSIDGDVWIEDPLSSSYPPSIAFKAMQIQGEELAISFLRNIREMVFLDKKNITKEKYLLEAVIQCGGDTTQFLMNYKSDEVTQQFYTEMEEGQNLGVTGFPTFIFVSESGSGYKISGMSGYENYVFALEKAYGSTLVPQEIEYTELELLKKYKFLATKEISVVLSQDKATTIANLERLVQAGIVIKEDKKFGEFWRIIE